MCHLRGDLAVRIPDPSVRYLTTRFEAVRCGGCRASRKIVAIIHPRPRKLFFPRKLPMHAIGQIAHYLLLSSCANHDSAGKLSRLLHKASIESPCLQLACELQAETGPMRSHDQGTRCNHCVIVTANMTRRNSP